MLRFKIINSGVRSELGHYKIQNPSKGNKVDEGNDLSKTTGLIVAKLVGKGSDVIRSKKEVITATHNETLFRGHVG